jgi:NSS family neurotransmitter:Na+ symporter
VSDLRPRWNSRWGLVLALAGNAIGLGNFLRFPRQAALNGGGAFLIPYFVALVVLGLPMIWMECAIGRRGGRHGHGHAAGMIHSLWDHPAAKYVGALGMWIPFTVATYYIVITSWCLAFSVFSLLGSYEGLVTREQMGAFLGAYQGVRTNEHFSSLIPAYAFFAVTMALVFGVLRGGIASGIEKLAKAAIPTLFAIGAFLVVRVLALGTPDPAFPERSAWNGLGFVWNPHLEALADPGVWVAAAGQVFFSLSIGWGIVHTYASYLRSEDDLVLAGTATVALNETAEVVLGGTVALTAAVAFFGVEATRRIAESGSFDLGFQALPVVFQKIPLGRLFGAAWFFLLFLAGLTSAVAMAQPMVALLQETWRVTIGRATALVCAALFLLAQPVLLFHRYGFLDELDYWVGAIALVVFALLEVLVFAWIFGMGRGWEEIERGALLRPPRFFRPLLQVGTPLYLAGILGFWAWKELPAQIAHEGVAPEAIPYRVGARLMMVLLLFGTFWTVRRASAHWDRGAGRVVK